jgi:hypothetical protein
MEARTRTLQRGMTMPNPHDFLVTITDHQPVHYVARWCHETMCGESTNGTRATAVTPSATGADKVTCRHCRNAITEAQASL